MTHTNPNTKPEKKDEDDEDRAAFFLFPFFRGKRREIIPILALFALLLIGALYFWQQQSTPALPPQVTAAASPEPVAVATERWGGSVVFPIEGKDNSGRNAAFDVAVLPKELAWVSKSSTNLALAGEQIPDDQLTDRLFTPELREGLGKSKQVMAIGLASQEGQVDEETARAADRAKNAGAWLAKAMGPETGIWLLNLGQFKKSGCPAQTETTDTSWQRPVIIVGVKSQDEGTDLAQAFSNAISGKSNLPSRECYTAFDLTRFR